MSDDLKTEYMHFRAPKFFKTQLVKASKKKPKRSMAKIMMDATIEAEGFERPK